MIDLHVHTHHSCDSKTTMEEYCQKGIEIGVKYICFTDHVDFNKADDGYGYYDADKYFSELNRVKEKYANHLHILSGIEFAEPHIYKKEFDAFRRLPYDFILGSVHYWIGNMFPNEMLKRNLHISIVSEKYWEEVYKAVSYGGFDSMAHIDFPKRYYKKCTWSEAQMKDIFSMMVKNNIALEINTSSLRKGLTECMPDKELLEIYKDAGGVMITQGADTHSAEELAAGYKDARSLISGKLKSTIFIERQAKYEDEWNVL